MRNLLLAPLLLAACGSSTKQTPDASPASAVDATRYAADLATIAVDRTPGTAHWQEIQDLCAVRLASYGFTIERHAYTTGVNVIGTLPGVTKPDEKVILSAHYDTVDSCPGADDNGSGVAGVLEAARVLAAGPHARTLVLACWDEEERGLIGSRAYVKRLVDGGDAPSFLASFVFEMIGYRSTAPDSQEVDQGLALVYPDQTQAIKANGSRGDFILVVHDDAAASVVAPFNAAAAAGSLPTVTLPVPANVKSSQLYGALRRSDHAPFWDANIPAVQLTDTADYRNPHYHCPGGVPDTLADIDTEFAVSVVRATVAAVDAALGR